VRRFQATACHHIHSAQLSKYWLMSATE